MAKTVFMQLKGTGKVTRGMIGVIIQPVTQDLARQFKLDRAIGALIGQVTPGGPAEKAGIKSGDIILKYQGQVISQGNMLPALVAETQVGTRAQVVLFRDGKEVPVEVVIGELPEEHTAVGGAQSPNTLEDDLGFTVQALTPELAQSLGIEEHAGLLVSDVRPGSIAADSGLQRGDLIAEAGTGDNRRPVASAKDLEAALTANKNQNILLLVRSNKQTRFVLLKRN
jgi:serine protease Do